MQTPIASAAVQTIVKARVFYGSREETIIFTIGATVDQCDRLAVTTFGIVTNPHTFGLFREDGVTELLPTTATIARIEGQAPPPAGSVGIRENEKLILRTSTVRGGA